jgi:hypothetical protein
MAERPDLLALLDGLIPFESKAADEDAADVRRRVGLAFPPYASDPLIAVLAVERHSPARLLADVVLFDGEHARVEIRETDGDRVALRWHAPDGAVPWGWDPKARSWRRFTEDVEDEDDSFARMDAERIKLAERAERRHLAAIQAAATRRANREAARGIA